MTGITASFRIALKQQFLLSKRIRLRPLTGGDAPQFVRLFGDDPAALDLMNGLPRPMNLDTVRPWIERTSAKSGRFGVTLRSDGAFIGFAGWSMIDGDIRIGYLIGREHRNRGFATECVRLILEELKKLGYSRILAETLPQNAASIRVLEKCGFSRNGTIGAESGPTGELREFIVYKLDI